MSRGHFDKNVGNRNPCFCFWRRGAQLRQLQHGELDLCNTKNAICGTRVVADGLGLYIQSGGGQRGKCNKKQAPLLRPAAVTQALRSSPEVVDGVG